jgi:hypothetical protein
VPGADYGAGCRGEVWKVSFSQRVGFGRNVASYHQYVGNPISAFRDTVLRGWPENGHPPI